jgi:hypothetical protein
MLLKLTLVKLVQFKKHPYGIVVIPNKFNSLNDVISVLSLKVLLAKLDTAAAEAVVIPVPSPCILLAQYYSIAGSANCT